MKILITGAYGQLGSDCSDVLGSGNHEIIALSRSALDISDARAVQRVMDESAPDVIVNCAAFTNVDACEQEREKAWKINVTGPRNLAELCQRKGAWLIHISSDYVFDGEKPLPEPYVESDQTGPISYYGITKWEGECAVNASGAKATILRPAWIYGANGSNFPKTILRLALDKDRKGPLSVVNDQVGSLTWSYRLAHQIQAVIEHRALGLYHSTAEGHGSWYEVAVEFLSLMEIKKEVLPCTTKEFPRPAPRPHNSILENQMLKKAGLNRMVDWRKDLKQFVGKYKGRLIDEIMKR